MVARLVACQKQHTDRALRLTCRRLAKGRQGRSPFLAGPRAPTSLLKQWMPFRNLSPLFLQPWASQFTAGSNDRIESLHCESAWMMQTNDGSRRRTYKFDVGADFISFAQACIEVSSVEHSYAAVQSLAQHLFAHSEVLTRTKESCREESPRCSVPLGWEGRTYIDRYHV